MDGFKCVECDVDDEGDICDDCLTAYEEEEYEE